MKEFLAYRIFESNGRSSGRLEKISSVDLGINDLFVKVEYSAINYKDALAATGQAQIAKKFPLIGGIDLIGTVLESKTDKFRDGEKIIVTGSGLSETLNGGYSEYAQIDSDLAFLIPESISTRLAAGIGTAGFTAALAIYKMKINKQKFSNEKIIVTGATGGVGSFAILLLNKALSEVIAVSSKNNCINYLDSLGVKDIINPSNIKDNESLLEKALWHGAIDNIGGDILSWLTRTVRPHGNIASIGLASSHDLNTNVMPLILRGINILGISTNINRKISEDLWKDIFCNLTNDDIEKVITRETSLKDLSNHFDRYITGNNYGRTIIKIS